MPMQLQYIVIVVVVIWLLVLTAIYIYSLRGLTSLNKQVGKKDLSTILNKLLSERGKSIKDIKELKDEIDKLEEEVNLHVQKIGLVRFNPFEEIGGDHSFSLALLDGEDTGVILTGLHTRQRTRLYVKYIDKGKSEYDLSKEEEKSIKVARKTK
jgi:hypothetical protein